MKIATKISIMAALIVLASCTNLDISPLSSATTNTAFSDLNSYKHYLAKVYGGLAMGGQKAGDPPPDGTGGEDISGINPGFSEYVRMLFDLQELSTDEAVIGWDDNDIQNFHYHIWTAQSVFTNAMFNRLYFEISITNDFLRQTTDQLVNSRSSGITDADRAQIKMFRAETRFIRALTYWYAIDMFGNVPIVTEANAIGLDGPAQPSTNFQEGRTAVFNFIESELKAIEADLAAPKTNEYPRADKAAAWMLLAKLYLNAKVYTGTDRSTDCLTYLNKIISSNKFSLDPVYQNMFLTDNNKSPEFIFAVAFDGTYTQTYGGTTFIAHASVGGNMSASAYGLDYAWWGLRTTSSLVNQFSAGDARAIFYTSGQSLDIPDKTDKSFNQGYAVPKFKNISSTGASGSNSTFVDTDYPIFRLADVYLMYAEAVINGGTGGDINTAVTYINQLRGRAYGNTSADITATDLNDPYFIIDERARELYWEGHRRTDLVRFGLFTTTASSDPLVVARAVWPWKGNLAAGQQTATFRNVYPIPSQSIVANPKLKQNAGY